MSVGSGRAFWYLRLVENLDKRCFGMLWFIWMLSRLKGDQMFRVII